jgi:N-acetylmuramic acid 6-phosphate etherase
MAGGLGALITSVEGAEDDEEAGAAAMWNSRIGVNDVVIGIAASGRTPFTSRLSPNIRAALRRLCSVTDETVMQDRTALPASGQQDLGPRGGCRRPV